jgi:iron complex outermembrane receptor protein
MRSIFYSVIIFLFLNISTPAQNEVDTVLSYLMDSVLVSSSRFSIPLSDIPYTISVVNANNLNNISNPSTIEGVLSHQPGVIVNNRTNPAQGDKISIRGIGTRSQFGIRGIKVFLDGISLTFSDGQTQLNNLNMQEIESAEILKGPSSVLYGNSLGGVIVLKSKFDFKESYFIKPSISLGSYGLKKYGLSSGIRFNENISTSLSAYYLDSKGFRKHSESRFYGINLVSRFDLLDNLKINVVNNYYNAPYLLNPSSLGKNDAMENPESVRNIILTSASAKKGFQFQNGVGIDYAFSEKTKIRTALYSVIRDLDNSIPGRIIELERNFGGIRAELDHEYTVLGLNFKTIIGLDYEFQNDKRKEYENGGIANISEIDPAKIFDEISYAGKLIDQDENVSAASAFIHTNFSPTDKLRLFAGVRYDDILFELNDKIPGNISEEPSNFSMNNFSYMAGVNYKIVDNITAYGNFASGFQTPTTNELSNNPFGKGFNKDLNPEKVNNYEAGIKSFFKKLNLFAQISIFKMFFRNLLIGYQSSTEETFYRNAGKAENLGVEVSLELSPIQDIGLGSSYSFSNFRYTDYLLETEMDGTINQYQLRNNYIPGVPQNSVEFKIEYSGIKNLWSRISIKYSGEYFTNDFNGPVNKEESRHEYINDSYLRLDIQTNYEFTLADIPTSISLKIENILNERYNGSIVTNAFGNNYFEPAAGRSFYSTIELRL